MCCCFTLVLLNGFCKLFFKKSSSDKAFSEEVFLEEFPKTGQDCLEEDAVSAEFLHDIALDE